MIKFLLILIVGYVWQYFSNVIEVMILKKMGKDVSAKDVFAVSILGYLIFIGGIIFLLQI